MPQHNRLSNNKRPETLPPTLLEAVEMVNSRKSKTSPHLSAERIYTVFRNQILTEKRSQRQPTEKKIWLIIANRTPQDQYNRIIKWINEKHKITDEAALAEGIAASLAHRKDNSSSLYKRATEVANILSQAYNVKGTQQDLRIEILNLKPHTTLRHLDNEQLINLFFDKRNKITKNNPRSNPIPASNTATRKKKSPYDITVMNIAFYDPVSDHGLTQYRSVISQGWNSLGKNYPERSKAYWTLGRTDEERMTQLKRNAIVKRNKQSDISDRPDYLRSRFRKLSNLSAVSSPKGSLSI